MTWWNSVSNLNAIEQFAAELLRFLCLTLWPWTCFKCCARLCEIIFTKFDLQQLIRARIIAFFDAGTLCQAVTLIFDLLTLKVRGTSSVTWSKSVRNLSEIEQFLAGLLIILRIWAHVMSRRDLDLWPLDLELLQHFRCHVFKLNTKFERNRIILVWDIDDLARFRVQF